MSKEEELSIKSRRSIRRNVEDTTCNCGCKRSAKAYNFLPCEKKRSCLKLIHLNCKKSYRNCIECST